MVRLINNLFSARRARLLAARAHLPDAVWQMLIFGLCLVAVYIYLFGPHSFRIHMAVTSLTMLSIGLVFTLIIALDYPFRGDLSVSDESYIGVKTVADHAFSELETPPATLPNAKN
jgi:ABC-type branched-subunit amino acid transport system permease subunit